MAARIGFSGTKAQPHRMAEPGGAWSGGLAAVPFGTSAGMVAGTRVATPAGWRPVEAIVAGDRVLTCDAGMQPVIQVTRCPLWQGTEPCPRHLWPLAVPAGALGNAQPLMLLPGQAVVVESDVALALYGESHVLVPAAALDGFRGIERAQPQAPVEVVTLHFARAQVIYTAAGVLTHCPSMRSRTAADLFGDVDEVRLTLGDEDARFYLGCLPDAAQAALAA